MNLVDRRVDSERVIVPISASKVRDDIETNKGWLENKVYNDIKFD